MSVDIEVNEDGETLLLKAARIVPIFEFSTGKLEFYHIPAARRNEEMRTN